MVMGTAGTIGSNLGLGKYGLPFWINSNSYSDYDNFDSLDTNKWTVATTSIGSGGSVTVSGNRLIIKNYVNGETYAQTKLIPANTSYAAGISIALVSRNDSDSQVTAGVKLYSGGGVTYTSSTAYTLSQAGSPSADNGIAKTIVQVIAKDNNVYDVYLGGEKVISDYTSTSPQLRFFVTDNAYDEDSIVLYIDWIYTQN